VFPFRAVRAKLLSMTTIKNLLRQVRLHLEVSIIRQKMMNAKPDPRWAEVKKAIRAHHLDAARERRIGVMAALENPIKRRY